MKNKDNELTDKFQSSTASEGLRKQTVAHSDKITTKLLEKVIESSEFGRLKAVIEAMPSAVVLIEAPRAGLRIQTSGPGSYMVSITSDRV